MRTTQKKVNVHLQQGLEKLGFELSDDCFYIIKEKRDSIDPAIVFHIENAREFQATALYVRRQLNGSYKPQAYFYDFTDSSFEQNRLTVIQKELWSSGEVPLAFIFYKTEIKIIDCSTHINENNTPTYLIEKLEIASDVHELYNKDLAIKIKSGLFWEEIQNEGRFKFKNSSYDKLISNIIFIVNALRKKHKSVSEPFINKIIVQAILIKYLEARIDDKGNKLLSDKYFKKYDKSSTFNDVLRKSGMFVELLQDLDDSKKGFNGNIFKWSETEQKKLKAIDLNILADLLETKSNFATGAIELWSYFEFKYIPVELISRLYEEFLGEDKKGKGLFYTPSHLVNLLIDEALPLNKFKEVDLNTFQVLDPACGSGIFLVVTFKRLVQIWRLQNNMSLPDLPALKKILKSIFGVDKEEQAIRLASFSLCLALCHELDPIRIINELKFDDLTESNLINSDFFHDHPLTKRRYNLIVGNPPFNRGAIDKYTDHWEFENTKVKVPQGQIALKFLAESLQLLKPGGLQCLVIKASGLLYNTTSENFKRVLFSNLNVVQIFDFTALGRNRALWDNGADVATAAIFTKNERPNFQKNVLHVTFRRTKATKERIVFEIDDYDLHFVDRRYAIENNSIWKNNLLGGGRVKTVLDKFKSLPTVEEHLTENECVANEGYIIGTNGHLKPSFIYKMQTLPTAAVSEDGIDLDLLTSIEKNTTFVKVPPAEIFTAPNVILWENIGKKKLPVFYNETSFSFKDKIIGIASKQKNKAILKSIAKSFDLYSNFYRFYIFTTSSQILINLNTAILKTDYMSLPFIDPNKDDELSRFDYNVISDVNDYMQDFIRHGENSRAVQRIKENKIAPFLTKYGVAFCDVLNLVFEQSDKRFRLADIVVLSASFVAVVFRFDDQKQKAKFHRNPDTFDLYQLVNNQISTHLNSTRIIKIYGKNTVIFVKPNQYRYWLSMAAYRDADKCFADLSKSKISVQEV